MNDAIAANVQGAVVLTVIGGVGVSVVTILAEERARAVRANCPRAIGAKHEDVRLSIAVICH
jgi:predicted lysophospholipase L1 biosynthesis ABC-type transport system permease subunit